MDQIAVSEKQNQRKSTRYIRKDIGAAFIRQSLFSFKTEIDCKLRDVSTTGVQISTLNKLRVNDKIDLVLNFDDDEKFYIPAKVVSEKELHTYISKHSFPEIDSINNKEISLVSLHLYESEDKRILAKFQKLRADSVKVLTYSALKRRHQYTLAFTFNNGTVHKTESKIEHYHHMVTRSYGVKFEQSNDDLGESLLETQTDLIFK